jgi:hypothetical protein
MHTCDFNQTNIYVIFVDIYSMATTHSMSASALAEQYPEDTYEQYEKYLHAGRYIFF